MFLKIAICFNGSHSHRRHRKCLQLLKAVHIIANFKITTPYSFKLYCDIVFFESKYIKKSNNNKKMFTQILNKYSKGHFLVFPCFVWGFFHEKNKYINILLQSLIFFAYIYWLVNY